MAQPYSAPHDTWGADAANADPHTAAVALGKVPFKPPAQQQNVYQTQRWLQAHGFNVHASGVWDAPTQKASAIFRQAWKGGADPHGFKSAVDWFNGKFGFPMAGGSTRTTAVAPNAQTPHGSYQDVPSHGPAPHGATPHGNPADAAGAGTGASPGTQTPTVPLGNLGLSRAALAQTLLNKLRMPPLVNPAKYGAAEATMEYGPALSLLGSQLGQTKSSLGYGLQQIGAGYDHAGQVATDMRNDELNTGKALLGQASQASENFLSSLGVNASADPATAHVLGGAAQRDQAALTQQVDTNTQYAGQRVADNAFDAGMAKNAYVNQNAKAVQAIQDQMAAQTLAKGAAQTKYQAEGRNLNLQRQAQYIQEYGQLTNDLALQKMLPGQIQGAGLANQGKQLANQSYLQSVQDQHALALGSQAAQKAAQDINMKRLQLEINGQKYTLQKYLDSKKPLTWDVLRQNPDAAQKIQDRALSPLIDPTTRMLNKNFSPGQAFDYLRGFYTKYGLDPDSALGRASILDAMRQTKYQDWNGQHWHYNSQKGYFFQDGSDGLGKTGGGDFGSGGHTSRTSAPAVGGHIVRGR